MFSVYDRHIEEQFDVGFMDAFVWSIRQEKMEAEKLAKLIDNQGWERYEGKTDDEIYYINVSPRLDGINAGMYGTASLYDIDYWYPRQEHKDMFLEGATVSGAATTLIFAFANAGDYYNSLPKCVNKAKIIDELNSSTAVGMLKPTQQQLYDKGTGLLSSSPSMTYKMT